MLKTLSKKPQEDGFYVTGSYELAIVPVIEEILDFNRVHKQYIFTPNPTDIDDTTQIPNTIEPDQGDGFYINLNKAGVKSINIRGTTGQFYNKPGLLETFGGRAGSAIKTVSGLLGIKKYPNGYDRFIELQNFFAFWYKEVDKNPSNVAMLFVNHKDAEFYQVVPMDFRKVRTAAKPLHYGYAITLRVIDEHRPSGRFFLQKSWLDRFNSIRSKISRWRQAVNQSIVLTSFITQQTISSYMPESVFPINDIANNARNMNNALQGVVYSSNMLSNSGSNVVNKFKSMSESMYGPGSEKNTVFNVSGKRNEPLPNAAANVVPPTRSNMTNAYLPTINILDSATNQINSSTPVSEHTHLNLNSPYISQYATALELRMQSLLASELAPIPDYTPVENSSEITRHMHQAGKQGSTGYLQGRENELASASLAAETQFIDNVRHPIGYVNESLQNYSLSYLASDVLSSWASDNEKRVSSELNSFRKAFLGMRDPNTLAPLYKTIVVGEFDSVYSLSAQWLGTWERWFELVLLNDLQYPYISSKGGLYCKKPGDQIIVPINEVNIPLDTIERIKNITRIHDRVKEQDAFLGFDIELNSNGDTVFGTHDFLHVSGIKAFEQEMRFILEGAGGVSTDKTAGPSIKIGTKNKGKETLSLIKSTLKQWLSADPRIEEVISVNLLQEGSTIYTYMNLLFKNYDSSIVIRGELRSA